MYKSISKFMNRIGFDGTPRENVYSHIHEKKFKKPGLSKYEIIVQEKLKEYGVAKKHFFYFNQVYLPSLKMFLIKGIQQIKIKLPNEEIQKRINKYSSMLKEIEDYLEKGEEIKSLVYNGISLFPSEGKKQKKRKKKKRGHRSINSGRSWGIVHTKSIA